METGGEVLADNNWYWFYLLSANGETFNVSGMQNLFTLSLVLQKFFFMKILDNKKVKLKLTFQYCFLECLY